MGFDERSLWIGAALLLLAVPALGVARRTPALARCFGFAAAALAFVVALDPRERVHERFQGRLAIVTTAAPDAAVASHVQELSARGTQVHVVSAPRLPDALAEAAAAVGSEGRVALVWNGTFAPPRFTGYAARVASVAHTTRPALPFDPAALRLEVVSRAERDRPLALVLGARALVGLGEPVEATVVVRDPARGEVLRRALGASEFAAAGTASLALLPRAAGRHEVEVGIGLPARGVVVFLQGHFDVREPSPIGIVGARGDAIAQLLRVQGRTAEVLAQLPERADGHAAFVVLDALSPAEQERLAAFVEAGAGVLLCAAEGGGAIARPSEVLGRLQPVVRRDPDPAGPDGGAQPGSGPERAPEQLPPAPEPPPPSSRPTPREESLPPPPATTPPPAAGETGEARVRDPKPIEVERRSVALVLLLDVSGSMSEPARVDESRPKLEYAKASAFATAAALLPGDELAIVSFGESATTVLPLSGIEDVPKFEKRIEGLRANQRDTRVKDALDRAHTFLQRSQAAVRHVVIVTDGMFHDGLIAHRSLQRLRADGVTTSLVQILGSGVSDDPVAAKAFADAGGGTYATPLGGADVPRVVSTEVRTQLAKVGRVPRGEGAAKGPGPGAARAPAPEPRQEAPAKPPPASRPQSVREDPAPTSRPDAPRLWPVRALAESRLLAPRPQGEYPALTGLVPCVARPEAHTLLVAGSEGVPLLAFANRGLGKIGAFCSDPVGAWTTAFRAEPGHPARFSQWLAFLDRPREGDAERAEVPLAIRLEPALPTPAEVRALEAATGQPLRPLAELVGPPPSEREVARGLARDGAVALLLGLVVLALSEYLIARRAARPQLPVAAPASPGT